MHGWIFRLILKSTWPIMYRVLRNTHCTLDSSYLDDRNSHTILNHNVLWNETNCRDKVCRIDFFSGNKFNNKLVEIWNNWLKINKNLFLNILFRSISFLERWKSSYNMVCDQFRRIYLFGHFRPGRMIEERDDCFNRRSRF